MKAISSLALLLASGFPAAGVYAQSTPAAGGHTQPVAGWSDDSTRVAAPPVAVPAPPRDATRRAATPVDSGAPKHTAAGSTAPDSKAAKDTASARAAPAAPDSTALAESAAPDTTPGLSFLIPADGDVIYAADVKIVAYVRGPTPAGMLAVLDGFSLAIPLHLESGILTVDLPGLHSGVHEVKVVFLDAHRQISLSRTVRFFVRVPEPHRKPVEGTFRQFGRVVAQADWKGADAEGQVVKQSQLNRVSDSTYRLSHGETPLSQNVDGAAEVSYSIKDEHWEGYLKGLISTDEDQYRQPDDRLSGRITYGPWATVRGGDLYPVYNDLILNGTRVRGGEVDLAAVTDDGTKHWVYAKMVTGETKRAVPAFVAEYDTGNGNTVQDTIPATAEQRLTAIRVGAGGGQTFDVGLTVMKASDRDGDSASQLLNNQLNGVQPVDNLVSGLDMRVGIWQGRIQIYGGLATSLYTLDRAIGPDSNLSRLQSLVVANGTTRGWEYVFNDTARDVMGFLKVNTTYDAGVTASIPFDGFVSETQLRYSYLGLDYHSEGNPFLAANPGGGWDLLQHLVVLQNRLFFGVEVQDYVENLGLYDQDERAFKGEIRFLPGAYQPALWVNGGLTVRAPEGDYPYQFNQQFSQFNVGGFHQLALGPGTLHGTVLYGYTRSVLRMSSNLPDTAAVDSLLSFPVSQTNIVNGAFQYKFRGSDFTPKCSYTFADNGAQPATNNSAVGVEDAFLRERLRADVEMLVGQYPNLENQNDLSLGESVDATVRFTQNQTLRLNQKWIQYGDRNLLTAGAYYEMFF